MTEQNRTKMVAEIRALADFVEERTDLPVPTSVHAQRSCTDTTKTRDLVERAALALGVEPRIWPGNMSAGHKISAYPVSVDYVVHGFLDDEPADEAIVDDVPPIDKRTAGALRSPAPIAAVFGLDRHAVRWLPVGAVSWQARTGGTTRTTAELIEKVGPISWWDADGHQIGDSLPSGRCGESVRQADYDTPKAGA